MCATNSMYATYRKIPIISPGLIFVQRAFLVDLFSGELIFGGKNFAIQNGLDLKPQTACNSSH